MSKKIYNEIDYQKINKPVPQPSVIPELPVGGPQPGPGYTPPKPEPYDFSCRTDSDCEVGQICVTGMCITSAPELSPVVPQPVIPYPLLPTFVQSSQQAFYFFMNATIDGESLSRNDWIGAFRDGYCSNTVATTEEICDLFANYSCEGTDSFCDAVTINYENETYDLETSEHNCTTGAGGVCNWERDNEWYPGEICVGARKWGDCRRGTPCDVPVMGYDASNDNTIGYMTPGVIPYFKMYDASSGKYIKVKPLEDYPSWENNGIFEVKISELSPLPLPLDITEDTE